MLVALQGQHDSSRAKDFSRAAAFGGCESSTRVSLGVGEILCVVGRAVEIEMVWPANHSITGGDRAAAVIELNASLGTSRAAAEAFLSVRRKRLRDGRPRHDILATLTALHAGSWLNVDLGGIGSWRHLEFHNADDDGSVAGSIGAEAGAAAGAAAGCSSEDAFLPHPAARLAPTKRQTR